MKDFGGIRLEKKRPLISTPKKKVSVAKQLVGTTTPFDT